MILPILFLVGGGWLLWRAFQPTPAPAGQVRPVAAPAAPTGAPANRQAFLPGLPGNLPSGLPALLQGLPGIVPGVPVIANPTIPGLTPPAAGLGLGTVTTQTTNLNLRASPSTDAPILASMPPGSTVAILSTTVPGWYQVFYGGRTGWAAREFVTPTTPVFSNGLVA